MNGFHQTEVAHHRRLSLSGIAGLKLMRGFMSL